MTSPLIVARNLRKEYGDLVAVDRVGQNLEVVGQRSDALAYSLDLGLLASSIVDCQLALELGKLDRLRKKVECGLRGDEDGATDLRLALASLAQLEGASARGALEVGGMLQLLGLLS